MKASRIRELTRTRLTTLLVVFVLLLATGFFQPSLVFAGQVAPRSLKLSDSTASAQAGVHYQLDFTTPGISTIGSVKIEFCSNTSLLDDTCTPPAGFDISTASLASQSSSGPFAISSSTTQNEMILTRPPMFEPSAPLSFTFLDVRNPSVEGSYYARIFTYPSSDATGPFTDGGGLAFVINRSVNVDAEVPPYIKFCLGESITGFDCTTATEPFSDLGNLSPSFTSAAQSQMVIATNAQNGYSMWVSGSTMMSGGNVINAMNGTTATPGTSQFGLNLRANSAPAVGQDPSGPGSAGVTPNYNQQNIFRFATGDVLATVPQPDDHRKYTVSYVVNIPSGTPGGVYSTTLTYVCLANF
jgi:hypothetical protein